MDDWEYVCQSPEELSQKADINTDILNSVSETLGNTRAMVESVATKLENIVPPNFLLDTPHANEPLLETVKTSLEEIRERLPPKETSQYQFNPDRPRPASYAKAVTTNNLNRTQKEIIAKSEARSRQIAIKSNAENIKSLSEKELAAMATKALSSPDTVADQPPFYCRSVRKTKSDIIILELSSKEGARWLSTHKNKLDFIDRFNPDIQILEPSFKTKAEFIPVTLEAENRSHLREIETTSDLPANSITKVVWMRHPTSRKPHQRVAHAFITFNSPEAANKAIRDGLSIEGKKVTASRTYPDPMRCFRYQHLHNHLISNCPEKEDTCGTSGKHNHHTSQCTETCTENFYCVNCETHQHTSWDRNYPSYLKEKERLRTQHPEQGCKYFPIDDDLSTWPDLHGPPADPADPTNATNTRRSTPPPPHTSEATNPHPTPPGTH